MTRLARFYAALVVLSRSLHSAFLQSPDFVDAMAVNAPELLLAAKELRQVELFKDSLLLFLGPWERPLFTKIEDKELRILAEKYFSKIGFDVADRQARVLVGLSHDGKSCEAWGLVQGTMCRATLMSIGDIYNDVLCIPCFIGLLARR